MYTEILGFYDTLNLWLFVLCIIFLVCSIDDCFIDLVYWVRRGYRFLFNKTYKVFNINILRAQQKKPIAIMVPTWQEDSVIAQMLESNIKYIEYKDYMFFVGVYQNDLPTAAEVDRVIAKYPTRVKKVVVPHDGPTCKADSLNWVIQAIFLHEKNTHKNFDMIIMHDAEDVIHPLEFLLFNYMIRKKDFIQIPVRALERGHLNMVSGIYMDEFAEYHNKDLVIRGLLCGIVPSAGVASCFSRKAIQKLSLDSSGQVFNTDSLTEDYDISYRLSKYNIKQIFATFKIDVGYAKNIFANRTNKKVLPIAVAEYFPSTFWGAIKQRTRWNIGIFYQSAGHLTWRGGFFTKYFFLRDRKGIISNFITLPAYIIFFIIIGLWIAYEMDIVPKFMPNFPIWMIKANMFFLFVRIFERFYFTTEAYSLWQGFLSIPRILVSNIINFCSTFRATYIYIKAKILGQKIAWDKTPHEYPSMEALEMKYSDIETYLVKQKILDGKKLSTLLQKNKISKKDIISYLLEQGVLSSSDLLKNICDWTGYEKAVFEEDLKECSLLLSKELIVKHCAFPIGLIDNKTLLVATYKPLPEKAVKEILAQGFQAVIPKAIINTKFDELIEQYFGN